jgi:four helix bundle protein
LRNYEIEKLDSFDFYKLTNLHRVKTYTTLDDLEIYQRAMDLGKIVYEMVSTWKIFDRDTVGKQLVRSTDSIAANIAEGYGRFHFGDKKLFSYYARGSLLETVTWLKKARQRNLIEEERYNTILESMRAFHLMLNMYIKTFKDTPKK